ncbi:hypothetical protein [Chryseobacterium flavum]|uniref:hypothetical protein n=1 Tax=Chryseobacterium flavum TaxID=415851 RepID=UPI0028A7E6E7|nr:hypothetical protein [Chryseobacterium flavum]
MRRNVFLKYRFLKRNRTDFETRFGADSKKYSGVKLMETFFRFNDLAGSKEKLNGLTHYAVKSDRWIKEDPSVLFQFHQAMRSFVRAGYLISIREKKQDFNIRPENAVPWLPGLLSEKEYRNPLQVFKKAFKEYSVEEFDCFMSGVVYFSMGIYDRVPESNMIGPYIHLTKMLDAAHLILERRVEKILTTA